STLFQDRESRGGATGPPPVAATSRSTVVAITRKPVHRRIGPTLTSQSLGVVPAGSVLHVEERRTDGCHGGRFGRRTGSVARTSWILATGVALVRQTVGRVSDVGGNVRLREQPSTVGPVITGVPAGLPVIILGFTQSGWVLVTAQSKTGFLWGGLM